MRFLIFLTAILTPVFIYLGVRLASSWVTWALLLVLMLLIMSFPFKKLFRYQVHLIYFGMGFLTFLTVFTVVRDIAWLITDYLAPISYVLCLTLLSLLYGYWNAASGPRIRKVKVPITNLPEDLNGFTIAQISDLHIGATIRRPYVEKVVQKINSLASDVIVMTGDIGDGVVSHFQDDIDPLKNLRATYGTYFTPGNHEYYWNVNEWLNAMKAMGTKNLLNQSSLIQHGSARILIAGIPDPVARVQPKLDYEHADFKILLSHRPGIAPEAARHNFQLQLSGHTHAGQFFPWTIVVKFVHRLSRGLHAVGNMWVYVNPGTGSWGPLIRLGTTPEITLLELYRSREVKLIND